MDTFDSFIRTYPNKEVKLKYLYEYEPLSTAGGLFHYRDTFQKGAASDENLLFLNSDVCNLFPLEKLIKTHIERDTIGTILCATSENERSKGFLDFQIPHIFLGSATRNSTKYSLI